MVSVNIEFEADPLTHQVALLPRPAKNKYLISAAPAKTSTPNVTTPPAIMSHPQFIMLFIMCCYFLLVLRRRD